MWKNVVEPDSPQMIIWRMRFACWIPKAARAHTPSEYVILTAFPLQKWFTNARVSHCMYRTLRVCLWLFFDTCFCCLRFCVIFSSTQKRHHILLQFPLPLSFCNCQTVTTWMPPCSSTVSVPSIVPAVVTPVFLLFSSCSDAFLMAASDFSSVGKSETRGGIQRGFETHCHRGTKHGFLRPIHT